MDYKAKEPRMKQRESNIEESKFFRSNVRGNYCESCGKLFEDGDIIFTPEETSFSGQVITRFFCGDNCLSNEVKRRQEYKRVQVNSKIRTPNY